MASRTIGAKFSTMLIIFLMTRITICRRAFEYIVDMTLLALNTGMFTFQFESRKVVVKGGFFPIGWSVAGAAVRSKSALVGILRGVTGITILRGGCEIS